MLRCVLEIQGGPLGVWGPESWGMCVLLGFRGLGFRGLGFWVFLLRAFFPESVGCNAGGLNN